MDLVIGSSSQLAQYFPENYIKISSRNIDFEYLKNNVWDSVYITFAEQKIYDKNIDYITPNYIYSLKIIESLLINSKKIVCYTSCELWSNLNGKISLDTEPCFDLKNEYTISKLLLWNKIKERRIQNQLYEKIIFIHPFYFNSIYRNEYFLFGKIFKSILNENKINVGNLNFYRDIVSTQFVVNKSIEKTSDCMVGSGNLINIRTFIKDLYKLNDMDFNRFVTEDVRKPIDKKKLIMANVNWEYTYKNLLEDTQRDIEQFKLKNWANK